MQKGRYHHSYKDASRNIYGYYSNDPTATFGPVSINAGCQQRIADSLESINQILKRMVQLMEPGGMEKAKQEKDHIQMRKVWRDWNRSVWIPFRYRVYKKIRIHFAPYLQQGSFKVESDSILIASREAIKRITMADSAFTNGHNSIFNDKDRFYSQIEQLNRDTLQEFSDRFNPEESDWESILAAMKPAPRERFANILHRWHETKKLEKMVDNGKH